MQAASRDLLGDAFPPRAKQAGPDGGLASAALRVRAAELHLEELLAALRGTCLM